MKNLICDKLLELMESKPYDRIRVTELTRYAGIGRSTFYLHFDSIYAVLQHIEDNFIDGMPWMDEYTRESILSDRRFKLDYFRYLRDNKRAYRILNGPNGDPSFRVRLYNRSRRILLSPELIAEHARYAAALRMSFEFFQGGVNNLIAWWLEHDDEASVAEVVDLVDRLVSGLFPDPI